MRPCLRISLSTLTDDRTVSNLNDSNKPATDDDSPGISTIDLKRDNGDYVVIQLYRPWPNADFFRRYYPPGTCYEQDEEADL